VIRLEHADRKALLAVVRVQARLLRATTAEDVAAALGDAVGELGGRVVPATDAEPDALPFDLSCGTSSPVLPAAAPGSRARARLEHVLPVLLEDARVAIARATHDVRQAELVQVDSLTGLLNRRATERLLARLTEADAVAVLDLDHFKQVNDRYGHAAGDEVLAEFGRLLRERGRVQDRYGRLGGEEFAGVFPARSAAEVAEALERLQADWRSVAPYATTFSAGVAGVGPGGGEKALEAADAALYAAKRAGRDTIRVALAAGARSEGVGANSGRAKPRPTPASVLPTLMEHLGHGEARAAADLVLNLLDTGLSLQEVITDLLAPAQREVGRRWQIGVWSVAEEHVATSVIDGVLAGATFRAGRIPTGDEALQPVLVVCPEGEWHQLPSRMFAALLAEEGIPVVELGPSLPAKDLQRVLAGRRYGAVVLSCTLSTSLLTAAEVVRTAHEAGVPVLAGGQAFGPDDARARALGADGWADTSEAAAVLLRSWAETPQTLAAPSVVVVAEQLTAAVSPAARHRIVERLRQRRPSVVPDERAALAATYEDLGHILRHLDAAVAVDDPRLFLDFSRWLVTVLTARSIPAEAVTAGYEEIEAELGPRQARAAQLLQQCRHALEEAAVRS
jgi:diguanylate cyclase (GGDEF)-like protein